MSSLFIITTQGNIQLFWSRPWAGFESVTLDYNVPALTTLLYRFGSPGLVLFYSQWMQPLNLISKIKTAVWSLCPWSHNFSLMKLKILWNRQVGTICPWPILRNMEIFPFGVKSWLSNAFILVQGSFTFLSCCPRALCVSCVAEIMLPLKLYFWIVTPFYDLFLKLSLWRKSRMTWLCTEFLRSICGFGYK